MAYEFQKLADVEAVEEFPEEGASVLIEHEGGIKKCPADGIGGGAEMPILDMFADEATDEIVLELSDGRTADEFVSTFEKNGACLMLCIREDESVPGVSEIKHTLSQLMTIEKFEDGAPSDYSTIIGGVLYIYSAEDDARVYLTNIDVNNMVLNDHYEWNYIG